VGFVKNGFVLLAVAVSLAGFAGMMRIKTDVQTLSRERLRLAKEQMQLRETKRVLEAEWAHLANPLRLQKYAETREYIPLNMADVVVLAPKEKPVAATGGTLWRRAVQREVVPAEAPATPQAAAPAQPESVMDALELPEEPTGGTN
jgi:hypothetical protein